MELDLHVNEVAGEKFVGVSKNWFLQRPVRKGRLFRTLARIIFSLKFFLLFLNR